MPPEVKTEGDPSAIIWPTTDVPAAPSADPRPPSPPTLPPPPPHEWPEGSWTLDFPVPPQERLDIGSLDEPAIKVRERPYKAVGRKRKAEEMEKEEEWEEAVETEEEEKEPEVMVLDESDEVEVDEPATP